MDELMRSKTAYLVASLDRRVKINRVPDVRRPNIRKYIKNTILTLPKSRLNIPCRVIDSIGELLDGHISKAMFDAMA
jgi:hypothetical protein